MGEPVNTNVFAPLQASGDMLKPARPAAVMVFGHNMPQHAQPTVFLSVRAVSYIGAGILYLFTYTCVAIQSVT